MGNKESVSVLEPVEDEFVDSIEDIKEKTKELRSKRGATLVSDRAPKGAVRVLLNEERKFTDRPVNVYREMVTGANGKIYDMLWWTTEDSKTVGKTEIVKINSRTEEEKTVGADYTIPYSVAKVKELLAKRTTKTRFYKKDGEDTITVKNPETDF